MSRTNAGNLSSSDDEYIVFKIKPRRKMPRCVASSSSSSVHPASAFVSRGISGTSEPASTRVASAPYENKNRSSARCRGRVVHQPSPLAANGASKAGRSTSPISDHAALLRRSHATILKLLEMYNTKGIAAATSSSATSNQAAATTSASTSVYTDSQSIDYSIELNIKAHQIMDMFRNFQAPTNNTLAPASMSASAVSPLPVSSTDSSDAWTDDSSTSSSGQIGKLRKSESAWLRGLGNYKNSQVTSTSTSMTATTSLATASSVSAGSSNSTPPINITDYSTLSIKHSPVVLSGAPSVKVRADLFPKALPIAKQAPLPSHNTSHQSSLAEIPWHANLQYMSQNFLDIQNFLIGFGAPSTAPESWPAVPANASTSPPIRDINDVPKSGNDSALLIRYTMKHVYEAPVRSNTEPETCTVCTADFENGELVRRLPCFHLFHTDCVDDWLNKCRSCPLCRVKVDNVSVVA